ncbi:hypothetical protein BaRGS_00008448 [Batillaria attramentaria]|uniref:C1q domain-containing protein n=1 Tax=Batillaria attramentaria TaxID=370345 RepID=A0ABD0LL61_9CAEN
MWSALVVLLVLSPFRFVHPQLHGSDEPCEEYATLRPGQDRPTPFCYLGKDEQRLLDAELALSDALTKVRVRLDQLHLARLGCRESQNALIGGQVLNLTSYSPPAAGQFPLRRYWSHPDMSSYPYVSDKGFPRLDSTSSVFSTSFHATHTLGPDEVKADLSHPRPKTYGAITIPTNTKSNATGGFGDGSAALRPVEDDPAAEPRRTLSVRPRTVLREYTTDNNSCWETGSSNFSRPAWDRRAGVRHQTNATPCWVSSDWPWSLPQGMLAKHEVRRVLTSHIQPMNKLGYTVAESGLYMASIMLHDEHDQDVFVTVNGLVVGPALPHDDVSGRKTCVTSILWLTTGQRVCFVNQRQNGAYTWGQLSVAFLGSG